MKTFDRFYETYKRYVIARPIGPDYSTMTKLTEEVGEVAEAMAALWGSKTKLSKFARENKTVAGALKEEIGDCLIVLLNLATACKIPHEDLFEAMTLKAEERTAQYTKEQHGRR